MPQPPLRKSQLINVRDMVADALKASYDSYVVPGITINTTHIPFAKLEDPTTKTGMLWIIASILDDKDRKTRVGVPGGPFIIREFGIQVGYQQSNILPTEVESLDLLHLLVEQFRDAVKNWNYQYASQPDFVPFWIRNDCMRDDNGVPFVYYMVREGNVFESYFTAYFTIPHQ